MNQQEKNQDAVSSLKEILKLTLPFCDHLDPSVSAMAIAVNKKTYETIKKRETVS